MACWDHHETIASNFHPLSLSYSRETILNRLSSQQYPPTPPTTCIVPSNKMLPGRRRMNVNSSSGMIVSVGVASLIVLAQHSDAFVSPSPRVQRINNAGGLMQKEFNSHSYRSLCQLAMNPRITMVSDNPFDTARREKSVNNHQLIVVCDSIHMPISQWLLTSPYFHATTPAWLSFFLVPSRQTFQRLH